MNKYINDYGLLNAKEADLNAENTALWTLEYLLLGGDVSLQPKLLTYINNSHTGHSGLYNQAPVVHQNKDGYMSPDQLIAFAGVLPKANVKNMWKYLLKNLFTYDNLQPNKINFQRTMQPAAVIFVGVMAGHCYLKPLLAIMLMISCYSSPTKTSGKLKAWVMFKAANMKITEKICNMIISKNWGSWKNIFLEYFQEPNNPIRIKASELK